MTPRRDLNHGANAGVWLAVIAIAALFVSSVLCGIVCGELPAGMHRASIVRVDTLWTPAKTRTSRILDSMVRSDSLNACYDVLRPRQRLDRQDSIWLELK